MTAFNNAARATQQAIHSQPAMISDVREIRAGAQTRAVEQAAETWLSREVPRWEEQQASRVTDAAAVLVERRDGVERGASLVQQGLAGVKDDLTNGRITARQARALLRDHANSLALMRSEVETFPARNAEIAAVAGQDVAEFQADLLRQTPVLRDTLAPWPPVS